MKTMTVTVLVTACLALAAPGSTQTRLWTLDKRALFPDAPQGIELDTAVDLDGNPATMEAVAFDWGSGTWHQGFWRVLVLRDGRICYGPWFFPEGPWGVTWWRLQAYPEHTDRGQGTKMITRLVGQLTGWAGEEQHLGFALEIPTACWQP